MKQVGVRFGFLLIVFCLTAIALKGRADVDTDFGKSLNPDAVDVWDTFLDTLEKRGLADPHWEIEPVVQEKLITYFKTKIDAGVSDGLTALPPYLPRYIHRFPEEILRELKAHAQSALEAHPKNGAAAKFLAIVLFSGIDVQKPIERYPLVEKAMVLVPNDIEICFFGYTTCTRFENRMAGEALAALERLLERSGDNDHRISYLWAMKLYTSEVPATPTQMYLRIGQKSPLKDRWEKALKQILVVFENELLEKPDSGAFYIIVHIYETLGADEAVISVFKKIHAVFEKRLEKNPNDISALRALASFHEKLGDPELAHEYRVKADPMLAWEGEVLHDFSPAVDLEGEPISLADYRGKVVLLDFWATWCVPCIAEMPNVKAIYEKYHTQGFEVIGISFDLDETALHKFLKENQLPWRQIFAGERRTSSVAQKYHIEGIPTQFLIDREGTVISVNARGKALGELVAVEMERKTD